MLNFGNLSTSRKPVAFSSPLASTFQTEQHKVVEIVSIVSVCMCIHIYICPCEYSNTFEENNALSKLLNFLKNCRMLNKVNI